jgi:hypothetical protein
MFDPGSLFSIPNLKSFLAALDKELEGKTAFMLVTSRQMPAIKKGLLSHLTESQGQIPLHAALSLTNKKGHRVFKASKNFASLPVPETDPFIWEQFMALYKAGKYALVDDSVVRGSDKLSQLDGKFRLPKRYLHQKMVHFQSSVHANNPTKLIADIRERVTLVEAAVS